MSDNIEMQAEYENYQNIYPKSSNEQKLTLNMNIINTLNINNNSLHIELSQISQNFFKVNISEKEPSTQDIEKIFLKKI
ncbi:unnamed protein product [Rhizophagus irregularis]|nr:unnamed protein product [Rhizophagus irregularis]